MADQLVAQCMQFTQTVARLLGVAGRAQGDEFSAEGVHRFVQRTDRRELGEPAVAVAASARQAFMIFSFRSGFVQDVRENSRRNVYFQRQGKYL